MTVVVEVVQPHLTSPSNLHPPGVTTKSAVRPAGHTRKKKKGKKEPKQNETKTDGEGFGER